MRKELKPLPPEIQKFINRDRPNVRMKLREHLPIVTPTEGKACKTKDRKPKAAPRLTCDVEAWKKQEGPYLWLKIHKFAALCRHPSVYREFLIETMFAIPCGECKVNMAKYLIRNPVLPTTNCLEHSVMFHNHVTEERKAVEGTVNEYWTLEEAQRAYTS